MVYEKRVCPSGQEITDGKFDGVGAVGVKDVVVAIVVDDALELEAGPGVSTTGCKISQSSKPLSLSVGVGGG